MRRRRIVVCFIAAVACGGTPAPPIGSSAPGDGGSEGGRGTPTGDAAAVREAGAGEEVDGEPGAATGDALGNACCVQGGYYACPNAAALAQCSGFDVSSCLRACASADIACAKNCSEQASRVPKDTSACVRNPGKDVECNDLGSTGPTSSHTSTSTSSSSASATTPTNACGGTFLGIDCGIGASCMGGMHCSEGKCYPTGVGNPCIFAIDCGQGNHCTRGCCASPAGGSACDTAIDCTSGKCTNGVCE